MLCLGMSTVAIAQPQAQIATQKDPKQDARLYADLKQYDKAAEAYKKLYAQNPVDADVYSEYLNVLLILKDFRQAEKIVEEQMKIRQRPPMAYIDMGRIYLAADKKKKAEEEFDMALSAMTRDELLIQQMANSFTAIGRDDYALKTYLRARNILNNTYLYSAPMARLYVKVGDVENAVNALLDGGVNFNNSIEDIKATMMELLAGDAKKIQTAQKTLVKRINNNPENSVYPELLTWVYTQKDDWEGALIQIEALDERNKELGARLLEFARYAAKEGKYDFAVTVYDAISGKGNTMPYYGIAMGEKLEVKFRAFQAKPSHTKEEIAALGKEYDGFLAQFPQHYSTQTVRDYATLEAQYADNPKKGIELLEKAIAIPNSRRDFTGAAKLQMGDYYVLLNKVWDASLIYSQVDKTFKEDMLGEDARFRNAKLSYYRGDFTWAQSQLTVLKASTSELIANDALYLSVLIMENIPPDSNYVPLRRFAYADLLMFQNKDAEAASLLDSISTNFPKHPLKDDILMQHAKLAEKHGEYDKALGFLKEIYEKHKTDVLGDDAVFKTAELYDKYLKQPEKAKEFYEKLVVDYPGSTYIQIARNRLYDMDPNKVVP
jgi:tetratricopeptide (TPR) repeat protein